MNISDRIAQIIKNEGISTRAFEQQLGCSNGVISKCINKGTDISSQWVSKIIEIYSQVDPKWLLTGEGAMLQTTQNDETSASGRSIEVAPQLSNNPAIGKPYYDVDFLGGFSEIINSQVSIPTNNIVIQGFEDADCWCNVTGHSMEPKINHGDIIALRKCTLEDIQYGEIYAVVLDTIRTIKILRRSSDPKKLRFVPINTNDYDEQEYAKERIQNIFEVVGSISKFF